MATNKVYDYVTEKIVAQLENGCVPWHKPWKGGILLPENYVSKKKYNGINIFLLAFQPYTDHRWLTFKQVKAQGGNVRKGEKGSMVIFWRFLDGEKTLKDGTTKKTKIPFLRYYTVFNVEQTEGWMSHPLPVLENKVDRISACEAFIDAMPEKPIIHNSHMAYFRPSDDSVGMPNINAFDNSEAYYCTLFHEITHWTGGEKRLGRFEKGQAHLFGSEVYSKEELVAELGAAFLCAELGLDNTGLIKNSAAYLRSWVKRLKEDNTLIISAASKAKKAVVWMKGESQPETETATDENGVEAEKEMELVEA